MPNRKKQDTNEFLPASNDSVCTLQSVGPIRFVVANTPSRSVAPRFLRYSYGQIWSPEQIPKTARASELDANERSLLIHPGFWLASVGRHLGIDSSRLMLVPGFCFWMKIGDMEVPVYLIMVRGSQPFVMPWGSRWVEAPSEDAQHHLEGRLMQKAAHHLS